MADTSFSKPSHTNGPSIKLYDLGGLPYPQGPYAEAAAMLGWDPVGLQWVKVHVDSNGNINTVGGTTTSTIAGSVIVTQGTASNLNATVVGTVTTVPSGTQTTSPTGTQAVSGTVTSISGTASNLLAQVSGTVTSVPSGTQSVSIAAGTAAVTQATSPWVVSQGTASNFQATITGTVALSGTQTVVGTVTNVPSGTQPVSQVGSPWGVSGTVTTTPSGTQSVSVVGGTVAVTQSTTPWLTRGTATVITVSNPAAGADWGVAISATNGVRIHGIIAQLVTSTQAANRQPSIAINDGVSVNYYKVRATASQVASTTNIYQFYEGVPRETQLGGIEISIPIPTDNFWPTGVNINASTANIQSLDQWSVIRIIVEKW